MKFLLQTCTQSEPAVACAHIADYYQIKWENHHCIAWNLLRHGYRQWAEGRANNQTNNLYGNPA